MIGLRTGMVSIRRNPPPGRRPSSPRVPESSRVRITGDSTSTWKRMTCATNDASPSTWTATGIPRLAEFTWPEDMAPIAASARPRPNTRRTSTNPDPAATAVLAANASIDGWPKTSGLAPDTMVNRAAGMATWKTNRPSTASACSPRSPPRPTA